MSVIDCVAQATLERQGVRDLVVDISEHRVVVYDLARERRVLVEVIYLCQVARQNTRCVEPSEVEHRKEDAGQAECFMLLRIGIGISKAADPGETRRRPRDPKLLVEGRDRAVREDVFDRQASAALRHPAFYADIVEGAD